MKPSTLLSLRLLAWNTSEACSACQRRTFHAQVRRLAAKPPTPGSSAPPPKPYEAPKKDDDEEEFVPKPLGRPIGFQRPPRPGENSGIEKRTWRDTFDSKKNLERRRELTTEMFHKPYFRDFTAMRYRKGKTFIANPKVFKAGQALYFPNFQGETLASGSEPQDTTTVLEGKVSVVSVFSSTWAENQKNTFVGKKQNPELHEILQQNEDIAQAVDVNVEENAVKASWFVKPFFFLLRRQKPEKEWGRYFLVRRGITPGIRETVGLLNSKVGYVFLLDRECKIRWAASGNAEGEEKDYLNRGLRRLVEEAGRPREKPAVQTAAQSQDKAQAIAAGA